MSGEEKRSLRKLVQASRVAMSVAHRAEADALIFAGVVASREYAEAEVLMSYLSFGSEVDTVRLITHALALGKEVALPYSDEVNHALSWHVVDGLEGLARSPHGMEEPSPDVHPLLGEAAMRHALCLVPGLSFDRACWRLGYGEGYFDRFLAGFCGVTMGLCREAQLVESLAELGALEGHDRPVDVVVTDERVYRRG